MSEEREKYVLRPGPALNAQAFAESVEEINFLNTADNIQDRLIGVQIRCRYDLDMTLRQALRDSFVNFNPAKARLYGVRFADYGRFVEFAICSPHFEVVPEDKPVPVYSLEYVRTRYPWLFMADNEGDVGGEE